MFKPETSEKTAFVTEGRFLYCPKTSVNVRALRFGLAIRDQPSEAVVMEHHVRIPRHYMLNIDYDIVDHSPTKYPSWVSSTETKTEPRPQQHSPLNAMKRSKGGILHLGCGHGKTVLALHYMAHRGVKTAVIIDKTTLIKQWSDEVAKHLNVPTARIGVVQGKRWVWEDHDIVIMSIHTLIRNKDKIPKGFYEAFGLVVFDECHHLAAKTFKTICHQFSGERLGLSATPNREDGLEDIFKNHLGEIIYSRVDQELIPEVIFQKTDVPAHISEEREALDRTGEVNHRRLCRLLGKQHNRTQLALSWLQTLLTQGHHILCLSHSVDNVTEFATQATEFLGVHVGVACGDVRADERVSEIENNKVSVGTIDIASEALNVPSLSALLILTPFGAGQHGNTLQQTLGRIQRKYEGKPAPVCVFLYDHNVGLCRGLINQVKRALRRMDMKYDTREHTVGEHT